MIPRITCRICSEHRPPTGRVDGVHLTRKALLLCVCFLVLMTEQPPAAPTPTAKTTPLPRRAPALRPGDTVGLVAPAGAIAESVFDQVASRLARRGFSVISFIATPRRGYLAADDPSRLDALNRAIHASEVKAILCMRGGYGTPRLLDGVDYEALKKNPKIIIGYSDITALLTAIQRRTGIVVFHGPMGQEFVGVSGPNLTPRARDYFWKTLSGDMPPSPSWVKPPRVRSLVDGVAEGRLTGGNLSMISSTLGTPYEIDTREAILFLEDVNEKSFRIDRMLAQLRLAGKLREVRGIILGSFVNCGPAGNKSLSLNDVFLDYFYALGVPVVQGYPAGHGLRDHLVLPLGETVRVDATRATISILHRPVD